MLLQTERARQESAVVPEKVAGEVRLQEEQPVRSIRRRRAMLSAAAMPLEQDSGRLFLGQPAPRGGMRKRRRMRVAVVRSRQRRRRDAGHVPVRHRQRLRTAAELLLRFGVLRRKATARGKLRGGHSVRVRLLRLRNRNVPVPGERRLSRYDGRMRPDRPWPEKGMLPRQALRRRSVRRERGLPDRKMRQ